MTNQNKIEHKEEQKPDEINCEKCLAHNIQKNHVCLSWIRALVDMKKEPPKPMTNSKEKIECSHKAIESLPMNQEHKEECKICYGRGWTEFLRDSGNRFQKIREVCICQKIEDKAVAVAKEYRAIDYTKIYEIKILKTLRIGDILVFDTERQLGGEIYKKLN